jgi:hypothetical protein
MVQISDFSSGKVCRSLLGIIVSLATYEGIAKAGSSGFGFFRNTKKSNHVKGHGPDRLSVESEWPL